MTAVTARSNTPWHREISRYQWSVLLATTLGWALDGFDYSLFTQVAGPATADLRGNPSTFHAGLAVTVFLTGWAVGAILFGVVADYVGRVRVLITGVLLYLGVHRAGRRCGELRGNSSRSGSSQGSARASNSQSGQRWSPRHGLAADTAPRPAG